MTRDTIYNRPQDTVSAFRFNAQVAEVFDDMISRSVPLYQEVQRATAALAVSLARPGGVIYDLGCSTGTTLIALAQAFEAVDVSSDSSIRIVGVDNSAPMLDACREKLRQHNLADRFELELADITSFRPEDASVVIMNYTLQFLPPTSRLELLKRICSCLANNGALLLTEKVRHADPRLQTVLTELHHNFKRSEGYSELEISQKREALENVLIPLTTEENAEILRDAGFGRTEVYLKWYTFVSFAALK